MPFIFNILIRCISTILLALICACNPSKQTSSSHTTKNYSKNDKITEKGFYENYSKKLGVTLKGTEDKKLIMGIAEWLGTPYVYGGCTKEGTDCSGFVKTLYKEIYHVDLNRSAADLFKNVSEVRKKNLKAGDLVFFKINNKKISHVGIYISNNKFVHAATSKGVMVSDLTEAYYLKYYYTAGRIYLYK